MTDIVPVSERRAALAKQYSDPPAQTNARMPEIRLSVHMSKKDIEKGHFFIVDPNVPQGEDAIITDIGTEFQCVVLRSCMKMSEFDSNNNKNLAETTEFSDFQNEPIFVIDNAGERPCLVTVAPYSVIKAMKYEPTKEELKAYRDTGGASGKTLHPLHPVMKDLRLQYIAYVLYTPPNGVAGIYSMKIGARGWLGMDKTGEACRYGSEAETSFVKARANCHKVYQRSTHMHTWRMFSSEFNTDETRKTTDEDGKEVTVPVVDHYPSFEILGEWGDDMLTAVEEARELLKQFLFNTYGRRVGYAWRNTSDREFIPRQVAAMLDSAGGQDEVAAILLGDKRLAQAAKQQLTVTGGVTLPPPAATGPAPAPRARSSKQAVDEAVDSFGGEAKEESHAPDPKPVAHPVKKTSTLKSLFAKKEVPTRTPEEAEEAATKNVAAQHVKPQTTDPNAPGYYPAAFDEGQKPKGPAKPMPVSQIPAGW